MIFLINKIGEKYQKSQFTTNVTGVILDNREHNLTGYASQIIS
jgi:hypothetical protein